MTRINLVPVSELSDQHLFAEFREIKMVPKSLSRSIRGAIKKFGNDWEKELLKRIPKRFTLNTGHVTFFYDKGGFLRQRFVNLCKELDKRGYNYDKNSVVDESEVYLMLSKLWTKDYQPTFDEIEISRERIQNRLLEKPQFYKYYGKPYF
jgi:deoxyribonuclease (pyrimidine dimer)